MSSLPLPRSHQILCALAFCVGGISLYASRSMVVVLFALVVITFVIVGLDRLRQAPRNGMVQWSFAGLLLVAGLSMLWSDLPWRSIDTWWRVALVLGAAGALVRGLPLVPPHLARRALDWFCLGIAVLLILLLLEWALGGRVGNWLKAHQGSGLLFSTHAVALLVVLAWPVSAWLATRARPIVGAMVGTLVGLFLLLVIAVVMLMPLRAAMLALALGAATWLLIRTMGPRVVRALVVVTWLMLLGAPVIFSMSTELVHRVTMTDTQSSWSHRLVIWQFFAERVRQRPLFGHGLGRSNASVDSPASRAHYASLARPVGGDLFVTQTPLHPHNSILQLWHDLGVAGVLCALGLITGLLRRAQRLSRADCAWIGAGFVSWLVIASISFGLWQKWWLAGVGIAGAIAALVLATRDGDGSGEEANEHA